MKTNIKKNLFALFTSALLISNCSEPENQSNNFNTDENICTKNQTAINTIDSVLNEVRDQHGVWVLGPESNVEYGINMEERIRRNISMISNLLEERKEKIESLNRLAIEMYEENVDLKALTASSRERIAKKEEEISELRKEIVVLTNKLASAKNYAEQYLQQNNSLSAVLQEFLDELNTAYYISGTKKELLDMDLISKKKGITILGNNVEISEAADNKDMNEIDIRKVSDIELTKNKTTIITPHPKDSYAIEKDKNGINHLKIVNQNEFWSLSKYLIVETSEKRNLLAAFSNPFNGYQ